MRFHKTFGAALLATIAGAALAQQPASPAATAAPAAAPAAPAAAAPPAWKQGMSAEQEKSSLHPFAPHFTAAPQTHCQLTS